MNKWMEVIRGDMRKTYKIDIDVVKGEGKDTSIQGHSKRISIREQLIFSPCIVVLFY